jgi:hypothetical protein
VPVCSKFFEPTLRLDPTGRAQAMRVVAEAGHEHTPGMDAAMRGGILGHDSSVRWVTDANVF